MRLHDQPRVAVLSLTRDRLAYTKHCFQRLHELAGCKFDHYVLDQGSTDGTREWLAEEYRPLFAASLVDNIGVSRGINYLLAAAEGKYDWYVKFDNDCELLTKDVVKDSLQDDKWILSPHIMGLDAPPAVESEVLVQGRLRVGVTSILGGIFMAVPAWVFDVYKHAEDNPVWGMDDVRIVEWFKARGGQVGYMLDHQANHYLTTAGQREDNIGGYYARKELEFYGR